MKNVNVAIKVNNTDFAGVIAQAKRNRDGLTGNVPLAGVSPTLAALNAQIATTEAALDAWILVGKKGSPWIKLTLKGESITLRNMLKELGESVLNISQLAHPGDNVAIANMVETGGFTVKSQGGPVGQLDAVQNFRVMTSKGLPSNAVKLGWARPANSKKGTIGYKVYKGIQPPVYSTSAVAFTVFRGKVVDYNETGGPQTWSYWIVPFNAAGDGAPSTPITVSVLSI